MSIKKMVFACLIITLFACKNNTSECIYVGYQGKVVINSINVAPLNENNCTVNPRKVLFVFIPNDTNNRANYLYKNWSDTAALTFNAGINPSQFILDSLDITVGKEFQCYRKEITQGTCTPVYFEFTELNLNDASGCR